MATIKSPGEKKTRTAVKATAGAVVAPQSVALEMDGSVALELIAKIRAHDSVIGEQTNLQDVSEGRTDLLVTLKPVITEAKVLDTSAFDSGAAMQFAVDALAAAGLTCRDIGKSHPRFVIRDIRVPADAQPKAEG